MHACCLSIFEGCLFNMLITPFCQIINNLIIYLINIATVCCHLHVPHILTLVLHCDLSGMSYFDANEIFDGKYTSELVRFGMTFSSYVW